MQKKDKKKAKRLPKNSLGEKWSKKHFSSIKVAFVYDRVNKFGGAERVLLALHKIFPKAPLFTSVYHQKKAPWARAFHVKTSFLQKIPLARRYHQIFAPFMTLAFRNFHFDAYDIVISVTSESAKAIQVTGSTRHVCICLTPTRYLWSGYEDYFPNKFSRMISFPLVQLLRAVDKKNAQNPHYFIAISKEVQRRIKKYYGRESEVLYPPITLGTRQKALGISKKKKTNDYRLVASDYFLVVSRLSRFTSYKRIDLAIKAATLLHLPLVVIGPGNKKMFQKIAGTTVTFVGSVSDRKLEMYYENAKALIFPGKEDFGLVMAEAIASGTPVIAYKAGGALEIVQEGKTGAFFQRQNIQSLIDVLKNFDESRYNSKSLQENAQRFSFSYFEKALKGYILKVIQSDL